MCWVCQHRHRIPSCPQDCLNSKWQTFNKVPGTFLWDSGQYILHSHCTFVNQTPSLSVLSITSCRLCWFEIRWRWHQWDQSETCGRGIFFWNPIASIILPKIKTAEFAYFLAKYDWDAECISEQPDLTLTGLRLVIGKCLFQCLVSNKMFSDPFIIIRLIYSMFCVTYLAVLINHR